MVPQKIETVSNTFLMGIYLGVYILFIPFLWSMAELFMLEVLSDQQGQSFDVRHATHGASGVRC